MIGSVPQIVTAVRSALEEFVLPELQQNTWTAGSVRSCLTLLTYLEDVLAHGPQALAEGIAAMDKFVDRLLQLDDCSFLDADMRQRLAISARAAVALPRTDLAALTDGHDRLKALLSELIRRSSVAARAHDAEAIALLRDCLREVSAAEQSVAARAGAMSPF